MYQELQNWAKYSQKSEKYLTDKKIVEIAKLFWYFEKIIFKPF